MSRKIATTPPMDASSDEMRILEIIRSSLREIENELGEDMESGLEELDMAKNAVRSLAALIFARYSRKCGFTVDRMKVFASERNVLTGFYDLADWIREADEKDRREQLETLRRWQA